MLFKRDNDAFRVQPKLPRSAVQDAPIGLVGHKPVDILSNIDGLAQSGLDHLTDLGHGMAKYLWAVHAEIADRAGRGRPAIDIEFVTVAPVGAEAGGEDAPVG